MKPRCRSICPSGTWQCSKDDIHNRNDEDVVHRNGAVAWRDGSTLIADQPETAEQRFDVRTSPEDELRAWWLQLAETEIERTVPKAVEYGATDLAEMGHRLAAIAGRKLSDQDAAEWGVWMYVVGKLGRVTSALERGELPSDDTVFDLGVYTRMVARIRSHGGWPGSNLQEEN